MAGPILLVGCGKMGGAMLQGWLASGAAAAGALVVEPGDAARGALAARNGVTAFADAAELPADTRPEVVVLAVKPQQMDAVLPAYGRFAAPEGPLFLSIAAGRTIESFARVLGAGVPIIRAMPNTPAAVARGITVCCANAAVSPAQRERAEALLSAVGEVAWVEDEAMMDPVTAVSGSGPAYVFLLIETLAAAGIASGLPAGLANRLARATVAGAGELARLSPEDAETLRRNVTSPGGTTHAALTVLMAEDGMAPLLERAVAAATHRSRELAS